MYAIVANGEIAVKVEQEGKGGRNQHFAALMINKFKDIPSFVFASYATDGCDYIEGVHGAIISDITIDLIKSKNRYRFLHKFIQYILSSQEIIYINYRKKIRN